ncbi:MAG TPA: DoxX family protein [Vicinamibacteria bacterium]|nr:DoxX family protein [Vicinamibacteria bacterium]
MERWLGRYGDVAYALLRFVAGAMFALHGAQKLFGFLGPPMTSQTMPLIAGVIELVGGLMIALGLQAGWAAFIASGEMAVAYFMVHAPGGFWPTVNKGELAVLYCFVFLYIATRGSGPYSLDAALRGGGRRR